MEAKNYDSFNDLPQNCRTAADRMENAMKNEKCCDYCVADLSDSCKSKIDELEKELCCSCGKNIALVAYQAK